MYQFLLPAEMRGLACSCPCQYRASNWMIFASGTSLYFLFAFLFFWVNILKSHLCFFFCELSFAFAFAHFFFNGMIGFFNYLFLRSSLHIKERSPLSTAQIGKILPSQFDTCILTLCSIKLFFFFSVKCINFIFYGLGVCSKLEMPSPLWELKKKRNSHKQCFNDISQVIPFPY